MKKHLKNRTLVALTALAFLLPATLSAQDKGHGGKGDFKERKEKVEALKKEYITKELALTETEAQKFWPLYDELRAKLKEQRKKEMEIGRDLRDNFEKYNDAEVKSKTDAIFAIETATVQLRKDYLQKYAAIIGQKRATKVLHLERQFKKELMERMRYEHPEGGNRRMPPMDNEE